MQYFLVKMRSDKVPACHGMVGLAPISPSELFAMTLAIERFPDSNVARTVMADLGSLKNKIDEMLNA